MTDAITTEAARLALKLIATNNHADNERSFLTALKALDDPYDRLAVALHTSRILAMQLRESARANGTFDQLLNHVEVALCDSLLDDPEDQP